MAGGNTYGVGTVSFVDGVKTDITALRIGKQGTIQGFGSDGDLFQKLRWAEDLFVNGDFETIDIEQVAASPEVGQLGSISFMFQHREGGSGYDSSFTALIDNALCEPYDFRAPHGGVSGATVPFSAYSSDGATSPLSV